MRKPLLAAVALLIGCTPGLTPSQNNDGLFKMSYDDAPGVVMIASGFGKSELCTGVAVSQNTVLTAAHCLDFTPDILSIRYNCDNIKNKCGQAKVYDIIKHDNPKIHDIAIIKTETLNIDYTAKPSFRMASYLLLAGYGMKPHRPPGELFGTFGIGYGDRVRSNKFSVKSEGNMCVGDSGGPAYDLFEDELVGILFGAFVENMEDKCGTFLRYMYVPYYEDWIYYHMY